MNLEKLVFVFGENAVADIEMHSVDLSREAEFISYTEEDSKYTLSECWEFIANNSDREELYEGVGIVTYDCLDNTHLLGEQYLNGSAWLIVDDVGSFRVGRLKQSGRFYQYKVGGMWAGWLQSKEYGIVESTDIVSTSDLSIDDASKGSNSYPHARVWDGYSFNSLHVYDICGESMRATTNLKIEHLDSTSITNERLAYVLSKKSKELKMTDIKYLNVVGGIIPPTWIDNWPLTPPNDIDMSKVPDAYVMDGKWVSQDIANLNWAEWVEHCNKLWSDLASDTRVTVFSTR